ncbi:MAG: pyrrolysine--tRNA(Pyl) ligase large subunit [Desulfohalobiaceae bacterium]|nr:pyrrolysine--tRNA(Pyl) ligase large subunit [Desulfohalobiaceae bacterium]
MTVTWSDIQYNRLLELGAGREDLDRDFADPLDKNRAFQDLEQELSKQQRRRLQDFQDKKRRGGLIRMEETLARILVGEGFSQVSTPIIMSRGLLARMGIEEGHPLNEQIFWLDEKKCLRPMLAPHLYYVLKDLLRLWKKPVRIFEIGPCFRKESHGGRHSPEFTMLNLVEMGLDQELCKTRIRELADLVVKGAGIEEYALETEESEVYGQTLDIVTGEGLELGSGAVGPHLLDKAWKVTEPWVGIGFGLERLLMAREGTASLARVGRSLSYLDGIRLNL